MQGLGGLANRAYDISPSNPDDASRRSVRSAVGCVATIFIWEARNIVHLSTPIR